MFDMLFIAQSIWERQGTQLVPTGVFMLWCLIYAITRNGRQQQKAAETALEESRALRRALQESQTLRKTFTPRSSPTRQVPCPWCGRDLPVQYVSRELPSKYRTCHHCTSELVWVEGCAVKPDEADAVVAAKKVERRMQDAAIKKRQERVAVARRKAAAARSSKSGHALR